MHYNTLRIVTITIIIICLLAIIFKPFIIHLTKQLCTEHFINNSTTPNSTTPNSTTPNSTNPNSTTPNSTTPNSTTPNSTTPNSTTPNSTTPNSTTPNSTTPNSTTPNSTSTGSDSINARTTQIGLNQTQTNNQEKNPIPTDKPDVMNIKYTFRVAGYVPVLDIILSRLILFKVWEADTANLNTTQLNTKSDTVLKNINEHFTAQNMSMKPRILYPEIYPDFEAFFTNEIANIPRLNVFITKNDSPNLSMNIIFTNFPKPEWIVKMVKYYKDPLTVPQTVEDYVSELKGTLPSQRENNTSNTYSAREISDLKSLIMPIELREKIERLQTTQQKMTINLVIGRESNNIRQLAPQFNELTQGLLTFISSYYPTLNMLYTRVDDDDTRVLLGLTKNSINTTDDLITPTLVSDSRATNAWSLSDMLGYPDLNGITYNTQLLFNDNNDRESINTLLAEHSRQIKLLARQALLQNSTFGTYIRNELIDGYDGIEPITDNIYTYYFNIVKEIPPANCDKLEIKTPDCFDTIKRDKLFLKLDEGGHLNKIYPDLDNIKEIEAQLKIEYNTCLKNNDNGINNNSNSKDSQCNKIKARLNDTSNKISYLSNKMPYVIYLPIYDFQYIKIIPKRAKGDIFKPEPIKNF